MKLKIKCKTTGSIMVSAILAVIVWIGIAQSMAMIANSNFKSIKSGRTALQAQQYADISVDRLKNINYDELDINGAHSRKKIEGISSNDWQDEVIIGAESTIAGSDDAKQRIATVNVYKVGDTLPRYTVEVPLSSQGSNAMGLPDYQNAESISLPYTVNKKGFVWGGYLFYGWGSYGQQPNININGKNFYAGYESTHANGGAVFFSVKPGDVINISDYQQYYFYFIPCY